MNADLITRIATAAIRIGVQLVTAGRHRDAEALAVQLEAMGPARKADVDAIEREALRRLRQDEPTQSTRTPIAPDFPGETCPDCGYVGDLSVGCPECSPHRVGGPLEEGD